MEKVPTIYILTNKTNKVLYVGVTSNLSKRIYEHKNNSIKGFTSKYNVNKLVWFETMTCIKSAIEAEKKIKNRNRSWKIKLIEKSNPYWKDLSNMIQ